jgi:hypothetical protein
MQEIIVAIIVICATFVVVRRYAPRTLRQTWRSFLARTARRLGWTSLEKNLTAPTLTTASCADGCGACKGCGPTAAKSETHTVIKIETLKHS